MEANWLLVICYKFNRKMFPINQYPIPDDKYPCYSPIRWLELTSSCNEITQSGNIPPGQASSMAN
jgi:hypothetical protein